MSVRKRLEYQKSDERYGCRKKPGSGSSPSSAGPDGCAAIVWLERRPFGVCAIARPRRGGNPTAGFHFSLARTIQLKTLEFSDSIELCLPIDTLSGEIEPDSAVYVMPFGPRGDNMKAKGPTT